MCLSSRLSIHFDGSQPFTSHANFVAKLEASNRVIGPAPFLPASRADHVDSRSLPIGVTRPMPVMTTRRIRAPYPTPPPSSPLRGCFYFEVWVLMYVTASPTVLIFSVSSSGMLIL